MLIVIAHLTVMLMTTECKLNKAIVTNTQLESDKKELQSAIAVRDAADKEVIRVAEVQTKVVEKRVKEIETVYVPQIEYIVKYEGDKNASSCENANSMLTSIIY